MNKPHERLKHALTQYGYYRKQGIVAKRTGIAPYRLTRILQGAAMYDYEIVAIVNYFPGMSYSYLLEGKQQTAYIEQALTTLSEHLNQLPENSRRELTDLLREQENPA